MSRRRHAGWMTRIWIALAAVIAIPLLLALLVVIVVNPNDYKPQIQDAVKNATGRALKIDGDIQIGFGFSPTIIVHNVDLANPPGFSRDSMASIGSIEADVALFPLIFGKLDIGTLSINDADVQVEINPLGKTNTDFSNPAATTAATPAQPAPPAASGGNPADKLSIGQIGIYGGRFAVRDDQKSVSHELKINRVVLRSDSKTAPVDAIVDIAYDGTPVAFTAETGPVARLLGQGGASANWPVKIDGTSTGTQFSLLGAIRDPLAARGYALDVSIGVDDLSALSGLAGGKLPPIHNLRASFHISDADGVPDISAVVLRAENSNLSSYVDGLTLDRLVLTAPATDKPIHAEIAGRFSQQPLDALVDIGAPRAMIRALVAPSPAGTATGEKPVPVTISSHVAGAELSVKGQIANPETLSGVTATVEWQVPDLSALSALVGKNLPAVKNLSFGTDISDIDANGERGLAIRNIGFDSSMGDLKGDLDLIAAPRRAIRGKLESRRIDVDALQAAIAHADNAAAAGATAAGAPARPRSVPAARGRVIPDTPIDFSGLAAQNADLSLTVAELRLGGVTYRDLDGHAVLTDGVLKLDPFQATLPAGRLSVKLGVDATATPPALSATIAAPGVALRPILEAAGQPDDVSGNVDIGADLSASGNTPRALAASLTGKLGIAMVDAELDNRMFGSLTADVLRVAHLPADALVGGGSNGTKLRCLALRLDSVRGLAQLSALAIQTSTVQIGGSGAINLADEQLGLRLRPALRTPGVNVVVPVRVAGSFADPQATIDASISAEGMANSVTGGISSLTRNPLGALTGAASSIVRGDDPCPGALSSARAAMTDIK
jgi:uncharacterized protein involved in outer membrane biogenesis